MKHSDANFPRLIGVIHLPPLPGSPAASQDSAHALQAAGAWAVKEAQMLARAGFEGIVIENFGDVPFYRDSVPPETVAAMAIIAAAVREAVKVPIGINVLRNDARSALAIAAVAGCDFIRVNVLSGVAATDQGLIEGRAAELLRERGRIAPEIAIIADAHVKHARTMSSDQIDIAVEDLCRRAGADAVIVTGSTTGRPAEETTLVQASAAARSENVPLLIGSGASAANLPMLLTLADGVIVGSALRRGGVAGAPLDSGRIRQFVNAYRKAVRAKPRARISRPSKQKRSKSR